MKKILFIITFLSFFFQTNTFASHIMGGDITYKCLGGNTYEVQISLFRDCNGITFSNQANLNLTSPTCGNLAINANLLSGYPTIVTPICATEPDVCTGASGAIYGVQKFVYKANVTLTGCWTQASDIRIWWSTCCRNSAITTLTNAGSSYFYADLNATMNCNNSPQFLNDPLFYAVTNEQVNYSDGGFDPDGDSLVFTLANCLENAGTSVSYGATYNGQNPLTTSSGISINSQTGEIIFTPNINQVGVICLVIEEFRNGVKIGEASRDIQIGVMPGVPNTSPILSGMNGTATASGTTGGLNIVKYCPDTISFSVAAFDPDAGQTLSWDTLSLPNGATFTPGANNTGTFFWIPTLSDFGKSHAFALKVWDDACPVRKHDMKVYSIDLKAISSTTITASANNVNVGDTIYLQTSLADPSCTANWTGSSTLSCLTCPNPYFVADSTATFNSTVTCSGGCLYNDQITIDVNQQIIGTITTHNGLPLANSIVNIYDANSQLFTSVSTDANGDYVVDLAAPTASVIIEAVPNAVIFPTELATNYQGGAVTLYAQNSINFSTDQGPNIITGVITRGNGGALDSSIVIILDTAYNVIATLPTDANGYYSYNTYESAVYLLAVPDTAQHPNQLPTYFFGSAVIQGATLITLQSVNGLSFSTIEVILMVGPNATNAISGTLLQGTESGGPLADVKLLLMNDDNLAVDFTYTSTDGLFEFNNVDTGIYRIWVDELGIDNELASDIPVLLNDTTWILDNLTCYLHSNYLEVQIPNSTVNTLQPLEVSQMTIQPNPATADVYLNIQIEEPTQATINIYDISGQLIGQVFEGKLTAGEQRYELSSTLQSFNGICIVRIQTKTGVISKRLLYLK